MKQELISMNENGKTIILRQIARARLGYDMSHFDGCEGLEWEDGALTPMDRISNENKLGKYISQFLGNDGRLLDVYEHGIVRRNDWGDILAVYERTDGD